MKKIYNFCYITTNLINGKKYVGDHSTNNLSDGYLGSGKNLKKEIELYGKLNFKLEILEFFSSKKDAYSAQKKYIKLYKTHESYGGYNKNFSGGQWASIPSIETRQKISNGCKGKTSHKLYTLIDPNGIIYKNIILKEIVEKFQLNFDTLRKHINRGPIKIRKTKNINQCTLNCNGWEVIRTDKSSYKKNVCWIITDPNNIKYELSKGEFKSFVFNHNIDWRTLNRFKNKGKVMIKNKSLSSFKTLNTEGWELIAKWNKNK